MLRFKMGSFTIPLRYAPAIRQLAAGAHFV
jgi:hypothetical protein